MTVNRTTLLDLPLPVTGTESGTWGDTTNNGLTQYLDIAIAGTLVLSTDADVTLTSTEGDSSATNIGATTAQYAILRWTATGSTTRNITALAQSKTYVVINATGGTQSIVLRGAGPTTGVTIISGEKALCVWNGSDFVKVSSSAAAGGSNTQVQYNSSGVLAGSSNMTFDGTSLTLGGNPTLSAGTANGVLYLNGSKVATSGSALTFDGATQALAAASGYGIYRVSGVSGGYLDTYNSTGTRLGSFGSENGGDMYLGTRVNNPIIFLQNSSEAMRLTSTGLGIGTSSVTNPLTIVSATATTKLSSSTTTNQAYHSVTNASGNMYFGINNSANSFFAAAAYAGIVWHDGAYPIVFGTSNTERMRLDSSGNLGIGTSSPAGKLTVFNNVTGSPPVQYLIGDDFIGDIRFARQDTIASYPNSYAMIRGLYGSGDARRTILTFWTSDTGNSTERARIDSSGNLGLGVTPSAWGSGYSGLQLGLGLSLMGSSVNGNFAANCYFDGTNWRYVQNTFANNFYVNYANNGSFVWATAPSGTAGNAITFTQAMTLDASGNLLVGTTTRGVSNSANTIFTAKGNADTYASIIASGNEELLLASQSGITKVGAFSNHPLVLISNNTERARITSGGYFKASDTGTYQNSAAAYHELRQSASDWIAYIVNSNAAPFGINIGHITDANSTGSPFLACNAGAALGTLRAEIRSNGGLANYSANDVNLSDRREKTNFAPAKSYLDTICAIPVQTFEYIDQSPDDPGLTLGVVAQDVQAVAPELVMESNWAKEGEDPKMRLSIYQTDLQYALMKCIQEQQALITSLTARVALLEGN